MELTPALRSSPLRDGRRARAFRRGGPSPPPPAAFLLGPPKAPAAGAVDAVRQAQTPNPIRTSHIPQTSNEIMVVHWAKGQSSLAGKRQRPPSTNTQQQK